MQPLRCSCNTVGQVGLCKLFVDPEQYGAAVPYTQGLQFRHVLAVDRYVEPVLAAVRTVKEKRPVVEKRQCRREITIGHRVEASGDCGIGIDPVQVPE